MSRLDYCKDRLIHHDCNDWKCDHCDGCNIFKAYCEGARRAKIDVKRREKMKVEEILEMFGKGTFRIENNYIYDEEHDLCAVYEDDVEGGRWEFCVTGVYNCGTDFAVIDMDALNRLKAITSVFSAVGRMG